MTTTCPDCDHAEALARPRTERVLLAFILRRRLPDTCGNIVYEMDPEGYAANRCACVGAWHLAQV